MLTGSSCSLANNPTLNIDETTNTPASSNTLLGVDPTEISDSLTKEFQDAQALAKTWRSDATLYAHTVNFPSSLARGESKRVYVFGSITALSDWWTVTVNEQTGERVRALIPREDYLGPTLPTVPLEFWAINSIQSLQIADEAGGKDFREENPGAEMTATLMRKGPNDWLWWTVDYRGLNNQVKTVRIHPMSGAVYDENGQPVAAPTESTE